MTQHYTNQQYELARKNAESLRSQQLAQYPQTHQDPLEERLTKWLNNILGFDDSRLSPNIKSQVSDLLDRIYATSILGFDADDVESKEIWGCSPLRYYGNELDVPSVHSFLRSIPDLVQVTRPIDQPVGILLQRINNELAHILVKE